MSRQIKKSSTTLLALVASVSTSTGVIVPVAIAPASSVFVAQASAASVEEGDKVEAPKKNTTSNYFWDKVTVTRSHVAFADLQETNHQTLSERSTIRPHADNEDWVTLDSSGRATINAHSGVEPKDYDMQYIITHSDGSTQIVHLLVKVNDQKSVYSPSYSGQTDVKQGESAKVLPPEGAPNNARFMNDSSTPAWATVANDGSIALKPDFSVSAGRTSVPVKVLYEDETSELVNATVNVIVGKEINKYDPVYDGVTEVKQGKSGNKSKPSGAPSSARFSKASGTPEWVTVSEDGSLSLKPGYTVLPGDHSIPVKVAYSDSTVEEVNAYVKILRATNSEQYAPAYGERASVIQNQSSEMPAPTGLPAGAIVVRTTNTPEWATVKQSGAIELSPGWNVNPSDYSIPVKITYFDRSSEEINALATVVKGKDSDQYSVSYSVGEKRVEQGSSLKIEKPKGHTSGTQFRGDSNPSYVRVNNDGSIVVSPGWKVKPTTQPLNIIAEYPDGTIDNVVLPVTIERGDDSKQYNPVFSTDPKNGSAPGEVKQGNGLHVNPPSGVPTGTRCEPGSQAPEFVRVNSDCSFDVTPDFENDPGNYTVPVDVIYPDESRETVNVPVTVTAGDDSLKYAPVYAPATVKQGGEVSISQPVSDGEKLPSNVEFSEGSRFPEWARINSDGSINIRAPRDIEIKTHIFGVKISYSDGTSENAAVRVNVTAADNLASIVTPFYEDSDVRVEAGQEIRVSSPTAIDGDLPDGTSFTLGSGAPSWVDIDPETGEIVVGPGLTVKPGEYGIPVEVMYDDGSKDSTSVNATVTPAPFSEIVEFGYSRVDNAKPGDTIRINPPIYDGKSLPPKTLIEPGGEIPNYADLNTDNGSISIVIPDNHTGGEIIIPVKLTFYDDSTETIEAIISVAHQLISDSTTPNSFNISESVKQGDSMHVGAPFDDQNPAPKGTRFEKEASTPDWIMLNNDGSLEVSPHSEVESGEYEGAIKAIYSDESSDVIPFKVSVTRKASIAESVTPQYPVLPDAGIKAGTHYDTAGPFGENGAPENTVCEAGEGNTIWITVNDDCTLSINPPADTQPGVYNGEVKITYSDGSIDNLEIPVIVPEIEKPDAGEVHENPDKTISDFFNPRYFDEGDATPVIFPNRSREIDNPFSPEEIPAGTTFARSGDTPDWIAVSEDGSLVASPLDTVKSGEYTATVIVTYSDGSIDVVKQSFMVKNSSQNADPEPTTEPSPEPTTEPTESPSEVTETETTTTPKAEPEKPTSEPEPTTSVTETPGNSAEPTTPSVTSPSEPAKTTEPSVGGGNSQNENEGSKEPTASQSAKPSVTTESTTKSPVITVEPAPGNSDSSSTDNHSQSRWSKFWDRWLNFGSSKGKSEDSQSGWSSSSNESKHKDSKKSIAEKSADSGLLSIFAVFVAIATSSVIAFHAWFNNHPLMR